MKPRFKSKKDFCVGMLTGAALFAGGWHLGKYISEEVWETKKRRDAQAKSKESSKHVR